MPIPAASKKRNNLFVFFVIALSVTTVAILAATLISRFSSSSSSDAAGKRAASNLSGGFSCTINVKVGSTEYEVNLQKPAGTNCTMSFVKPANLSSLSFEKDDEGLKVKYGELEAAVDAASIPQTSIFNAVLGAFDACSGSGIKTGASGKDITLSGKSAAGDFTLTFDSSMEPKSLSIPALKLTATFKDFQYS
jgi:hypothetical protein